MTNTLVGWHIEVEFAEEGAHTAAAVLLRLPDGRELRARGDTSRHPADPEQERVGEEVATARALQALARQLLDKAHEEIDDLGAVPSYPL
ncbi:DUF1876 domain-containing protein [Kitasatospora viridis]|uniref:Uncharacterized protein DUF1876 n=1 Tax=Kitasatospora viridis TaxID=281105 RepID=A0A561UNQ2_9ACTN|nr:DUF1876 domain-containing protein [Kitasatospora viridis]TWG00995.1 uncharacterized protein DUF1876 [Kitasatospora viridis]